VRFDNNLSCELHIRVDEETFRKLNEVCKEVGLKRSQLIRILIKTFLESQDKYMKLLMMVGFSNE